MKILRLWVTCLVFFVGSSARASEAETERAIDNSPASPASNLTVYQVTSTRRLKRADFHAIHPKARVVSAFSYDFGGGIDAYNYFLALPRGAKYSEYAVKTASAEIADVGDTVTVLIQFTTPNKEKGLKRLFALGYATLAEGHLTLSEIMSDLTRSELLELASARLFEKNPQWKRSGSKETLIGLRSRLKVRLFKLRSLRMPARLAKARSTIRRGPDSVKRPRSRGK